MANTKTTVHVRPLQLSDFTFVRQLAAEQPNFTIPPMYVLWLLIKVRPDLCVVAETDTHETVGYMLALPINQTPRSIYVWQLAHRRHSTRTSVALPLLRHLKGVAKKLRTTRLIFSTRRESAAFRAIRRNATTIFGKAPQYVADLPILIGPGESEFNLTL